jgi:hypothetical protein
VPIIRSFDSPFKIEDWTQELLVVPNMYGKIQRMGLFDVEGVATNTITFEEINQNIGLIGDRIRGERNNVSKDYTRKIRSYPVPHFPLDDAIKPGDIQGKAAYGGSGQGIPEQLDLVRARKLERIRRMHAQTLETARMKLLTTGDLYAPNGTIAGNFYTDFGVTRKEVDFLLGTSTTEILLKQEEITAHIQDNAFTGDVITEIVGLASPTFMNKLSTHPTIKDAYKFYSSTQEPLRNRVGGNGVDREFVLGNIRYIEYRGFAPDGTAFVPSGDCYFVPMGTADVFKTYFGPADRFEFTNTVGQEAYVFEFKNQTDTEILLQSESNFLNVMRRPAIVARAFSSN